MKAFTQFVLSLETAKGNYAALAQQLNQDVLNSFDRMGTEAANLQALESRKGLTARGSIHCIVLRARIEEMDDEMTVAQDALSEATANLAAVQGLLELDREILALQWASIVIPRSIAVH